MCRFENSRAEANQFNHIDSKLIDSHAVAQGRLRTGRYYTFLDCCCIVFWNAGLDSAMSANALIAYFDGHKNQRMNANTKMDGTRIIDFFGRISYAEINGSVIIWFNPSISNVY